MHRRAVTKEELISFEDNIASLFKAKEIRVPIHLSGSVDGKYEDELIEIFEHIRDKDYVFSTHRNHYHYLLKTGDAHGLLEEILQKTSGVCAGRSGSMHTISVADNFYSSAIVAGCVSIAVGVAWALKEQGSDAMVWCFLGDGAMDSGFTREAIRYADGFNLPIKFILENNNRSVCTRECERWNLYFDITTAEENVLQLLYEPKYPHVGVGEYVSF